MNKRKLTKSNLAISEIGLGCATLAFDDSPKALEEAEKTIRTSIQNGNNYFDTAPFYGKGLSEHLLGKVIGGRHDLVISSKVGRLLVPTEEDKIGQKSLKVEFDYSYDAILKSYEESRKRMGGAHIDILLGHDLGKLWHEEDDAAQFKTFMDGGYKALDELRSSGEISGIGIGVNEIEICQRALEYGDFDLFLLAGRYTLLERTEALPLLKTCADVGTDIIVGGPFNSGMLIGGSTYNYRAIPEEVQKRYNSLKKICAEHNVEIGAAALQFPLRSSIVKSVIPGPKTQGELEQIYKWANTTISQEFWNCLELNTH